MSSCLQVARLDTPGARTRGKVALRLVRARRGGAELSPAVRRLGGELMWSSFEKSKAPGGSL